MAKVYGIIQARMGSKRLPGKVLLKIGDKTILEILIERLRRSKHLNKVILATSDKDEDLILVEVAKRNGLVAFRGSETDVLDRFYKAAKKYDADVVVRITADNPLTDISLMDKQIKILLKGNYDYVAPKNLILGLGTEVISFKALEKTWREASEPYQREHVTPYIYENPNKFKIFFLYPPKELERRDIRLTIDTEEDYKLFLEIYKNLGDLSKINVWDVLKLFERKPELKQINSNVKQRGYHYSEIAPT